MYRVKQQITSRILTAPQILIESEDHEYRLERVIIFDQPRTPAKIISRWLENI